MMHFVTKATPISYIIDTIPYDTGLKAQIHASPLRIVPKVLKYH